MCQEVLARRSILAAMLVVATAGLAAGGLAAVSFLAALYINTDAVAMVSIPHNASASGAGTVSIVTPLAAGQYLQVQVFQSTGAAMNVCSPPAYSRLSAVLLR